MTQEPEDLPDEHGRVARVRDVWDVGFHVGHDPDLDCVHCPHTWGDHLLHADFGSPLQGGTVSCPEEGCLCWATWSTNHAPAVPS